MKFHDNSRLKFAILAGITLILASIACNLPAGAGNPLATPLPPIIWFTNTPDTNPPPPGTTATPPPAPLPTSAEATPNGGPITVTPITDDGEVNTSPYLYNSQAGDTLEGLSIRFSVSPDEITSPNPIPGGFIDPGQLLVIPRRLFNTTSPQHLMPDSEIVYSPSAITFDIEAFIQQSGGYLSTYSEFLGTTGTTTGAGVIRRVAIENSINPRLLLALLEYYAGWVYGIPGGDQLKYPMGFKENLERDGLYQQLNIAASHLQIGYYGWREGLLTDVVFPDRVTARLAPDLNAGTTAVQYLFARSFTSGEWVLATDLDTGFPALYEAMFGNPWVRAQVVEPLFPPSLFQPAMILPFARGQSWSYSGGPHGAWGRQGSMAALDFAPASTVSGCEPSDKWVTAAAPGLVVRSGYGVVVLDLDGDGWEQTGWVLLYLHVSSDQIVPNGEWVSTGDFLGHPSCEGGFSTGTHVHIARKYNGEWIAAGGPVPFTLSGWTAGRGNAPYEGSLARDGIVIDANPFGTASTMIARTPEDP